MISILISYKQKINEVIKVNLKKNSLRSLLIFVLAFILKTSNKTVLLQYIPPLHESPTNS